ncbi:MAG: NAD(+) synthase [Clostridia bacterium]|nr:NAD(+) synthase [Clostridia bacterium]
MKGKENKTVKVGAVSPRIRLADVSYNVKECIKEAKRAAEMGVSLLVFPELALTGATCGDLFTHSSLLDAAERGLREFVDATCELDMISFIGLPADIESDYHACVAAVYRGELLALIPKADLSVEEKRYFDTPHIQNAKIEFAGGVVSFSLKPIVKAPFDSSLKIHVGIPLTAKNVAGVIVCPVAEPMQIGTPEVELTAAASLSLSDGATYVIANAGIGESTTDAVYAAHNIIADNGEILAEAKPFNADNLITADVSTVPHGEKDSDKAEYDEESEYDGPAIPANPYLPLDKDGQIRECLDALEIQSQALAARVERSYSKAMVIGVSGGLDSTLALLVCARAADILGISRKSVIGVTMPCFGTTKRTKSNAEKLSEALGISFRTVDIKASVTQHLTDIGHDGVTPDVTYENAQARERTQVLMDIANMTGGLVVGTGDLSELVLGWATYNGDHMSMYAVNASVPKTMVRRIVEVYSAEHRAENGVISDVLDDILATPVSPELLPPKDGEIAQCTEELVGPYELHDYFIYCVLGCGMSVSETYAYAKETFGGVYDNKTISGWLRVFVLRFFSQQFKRSCMPDGPKVSCISVSPRGGLRMPSDSSAAVWLSELDEIERQEK